MTNMRHKGYHLLTEKGNYIARTMPYTGVPGLSAIFSLKPNRFDYHRVNSPVFGMNRSLRTIEGSSIYKGYHYIAIEWWGIHHYTNVRNYTVIKKDL